MLDGLTANLALYTTDKRNIFYFERIDGVFITKVAGLARTHSIELNVAGQVTNNLSIIASYAYTDAQVKDDLDYSGNTQPHTIFNVRILWAGDNSKSASLAVIWLYLSSDGLL